MDIMDLLGKPMAVVPHQLLNKWKLLPQWYILNQQSVISGCRAVGLRASNNTNKLCM